MPDGAPAGWLRAKTGSLTGTNSLAGIVTDASGRVLTFALISNDAGPDRAHRDRRPCRHAAIVRMRRVSARHRARPSAAPSTGSSPPTVGAKLARPGPPATDYTRSQVIEELAASSRAGRGAGA